MTTDKTEQALPPTSEEILERRIRIARQNDRLLQAHELEFVLAELRALTQRQQGGVGQADALLRRVADWLLTLPEKAETPYITNGMFAKDCFDAADVIDAALTAAPPAQPQSEPLIDVRIAAIAAQPPERAAQQDWRGE